MEKTRYLCFYSSRNEWFSERHCTQRSLDTVVNSRQTLESRVVGSNMREIVHVHANSFREHAYAYIMHANH